MIIELEYKFFSRSNRILTIEDCNLELLYYFLFIFPFWTLFLLHSGCALFNYFPMESFYRNKIAQRVAHGHNCGESEVASLEFDLNKRYFWLAHRLFGLWILNNEKWDQSWSVRILWVFFLANEMDARRSGSMLVSIYSFFFSSLEPGKRRRIGFQPERARPILNAHFNGVRDVWWHI